LGVRQAMEPQEGQPVPVAALEHDTIIPHAKEATAAEAERVAPLERGPFTVLEDLLRDAHHGGGGELTGEHGADRLATLDRRLYHLVVYGVFGVERRQRVDVGA